MKSNAASTKIAIVPSKRVFKFGDSIDFHSVGKTTLSGSIAMTGEEKETKQEIHIEVDLVGASSSSALNRVKE